MAVDSLLGEFPSVSLDELESRASLLRRTDNKYVLGHDEFTELLRRLRGDHEVLEIDGRREFGYVSTYFDTPDLRCFRDHVEDRIPRFKARTRLYRDTGTCVFEVKLKRGEGETDKRQIDHDPNAVDELDADAITCLEEALGDADYEAADQPLRQSLRTSFRRITLGPADGAERTTCDLRIELARPDGRLAQLKDGLAVVESKSEDGEGPTDRALADMGIESMSLSKYRAGIVLLVAGADDEEASRRANSCFELTQRG